MNKDNHLGNVLVTVSDKKLQHQSADTVDYYLADVVTAQDYYPFGFTMPGRSYSTGSYRYGFNGKEKDNDIETGVQDYGMRIYDSRVGRFLSVDPITAKYPELTPYQFTSNRPIDGIDQDGLEYSPAGSNNGMVRDGTTVKLFQLHPETTGSVNKQAEARSVYLHQWVIAADKYSDHAQIGPRNIVEDNLAISKYNYNSAVYNNISGGPFGALGYYRNGAKGSFGGAAFDGIMLSIGGLDKEGYLANPKAAVVPEFNSTLTYSYVYGEISITAQSGKNIGEVGRGGIGPGGYLEMEINVFKGSNGQKIASGENVFEAIYQVTEHNSNAPINGIRGIWTYGDNLKTFNELIKAGKTESEAALNTFTGRMAQSKGFNKVSSISGTQNSDGTYQTVNSVLFTK